MTAGSSLPDEIEAVDLRGSHPDDRAVQNVVRPSTIATSSSSASSAAMPKAGASAWPSTGRSTRPICRRRRGRHPPHLLPRLFAAGDVAADQVGEILHPFKGHPMAKAALEMAVLDAQLRAAGVSLASTSAQSAPGRLRRLGRHPRPIHELLDVVGGYVDEGYRRIKLKIEPGWDVEPVRRRPRALRRRLLLQVDANTAYTARRRRAPRRARPVRPAAHRAAVAEDDIAATPSWRGSSARRSASTSRSPRPGRRRRDRARRVPSSTSRPAGSAATSRPRRIHDVCAAQRHSGLVRRHARDGHRPRGQCCPRRAARTSPCPATPQPRTATTREDITEPSSWTTAGSRFRTGPGSV